MLVVVYCGTLIDAPVFGELRIREHTALGFIAAADANAARTSTAGRILFITPATEFDAAHTSLQKPPSAFSVSKAPAAFPHNDTSLNSLLQRCKRITVHRLSAASQFIIPGFIDLHIHAPQYQFLGTATSVPLMQWLQRYTFPAEERMADVSKAQAVYSRLVDALLRAGTTTAVYFATIHLERYDISVTHFVRAFIST
jgi:hypothetical protein